MKNNLVRLNTLLLSVGLVTMPHSAIADPWAYKFTFGATQGGYKKSLLRTELHQTEARISADYMDVGGITAGYAKSRTLINSAAAELDQRDMLVSGRLHFRQDELKGKTTVRVDGYRSNNDDVTGQTDRVSVAASQVSWLSNNDKFYVDLGYAFSRYRNQLTVRQFTPTVGFGLNGRADWIQIRYYKMVGMNPQRASGESGTSSLETKWTHYLAASSSKWVPVSATLGVMVGKRIYAVDMDAQTIANVGDLNTGSASLGLGWNLSPKFTLHVLASMNRFKNVALSDQYLLNVGQGTITYRF